MLSAPTLLLLFLCVPQVVDEKNDPPPVPMEKMVITATRTEKDPFFVPVLVDSVIEKNLLEGRLCRTVPEALEETPGVMVQKTSHGQGSPYLRGFTGFRTLFLIDGIRLNNSVFRDGPNQYWNTVDPLSLDRMEIVKGPGSVLYGSDAVGGTVNAVTRGPGGYGDGFTLKGLVHYRYSSAERAHTGRVEISAALDERFGVLLGGSLKSFGDLRGGRTVGLQRKTGYDEWDGDLKAEYLLDSDSRLVFSHQRVDQDDAWRTHKTVYGFSWEGTTVGNEKKRVFDQNRDLTYLRYTRKNMGSLVDGLETTFSYQSQEEEQYRVKSNLSSDRQGFDVGTLGAAVQLESPSEVGLFTYGVEYYHDDVESFKRSYNADGSLNSVSIQGPVADRADYDLLGVYLQDDTELVERLDLILGARYTFAAADADRVEDPATGNRISISDRWNTVVGSARLLYGLDENETWNLFGGVSQGFRAPNLSDLTRLDTARTNEIETPSPGLDPERFVSYELGLKTRHDDWSGQVAYFYTDIRDMIVRAPTGAVIDGDNEVTKKNAGNGYLHGMEAEGSCRFLSHLTASAALAWIYGKAETYPTSSTVREEDVLDRLMPPTGSLGLRFDPESNDYWIEGVCALAAKADKLSEQDKADTQRIPPGGTPGYCVFHLRSGWKVLNNLVLSLSLENITNTDYRIHGSGLNEPGRSIVMGLTYRF